MDWLEERYKEQEKKIAKLKPKKGQWAQLRNEFGDVWHEIETVFDNSMMLYCHRENQKPSEYHSSRNIRTVVKKLPNDARVVICKEGFFSERKCNLDKVPKRISK